MARIKKAEELKSVPFTFCNMPQNIFDLKKKRKKHGHKRQTISNNEPFTNQDAIETTLALKNQQEESSLEIVVNSESPKKPSSTVKKLQYKTCKTTVTQSGSIFHCQVCNAKFIQKCHLTRHILFSHENKRPYKCTLCRDSFARNEHLTMHIASMHEKKKPVMYNLSVMKPYKCELCSNSFKTKSHLKTHTSSIHHL